MGKYSVMAKIKEIWQKISVKTPPSCFKSFLLGNEISAQPRRFSGTYDDSVGSATQLCTISGYSVDMVQCNTWNLRLPGRAIDTVVLNPPFGTRKEGADMEFLSVALKVDMVQCNIWNLRLPGRAFDTVAMNPPFGTRKNGAYMEFLSVALKNELLWAAIWLYRATYDEYYLKYVVDNCASLGGTGWSFKEWAATWLYRATNDEHYLKYFVDNCASLGGTGWPVKEFSWNNKYAGFQNLLSEADCILGKSMSYLVGSGQKYPVHVHHISSSTALSDLIQSVLKNKVVAVPDPWQLPAKGKLKFNVDATFNINIYAAIGGIIRDDQGTPKLALQRRLTNVLQSTVAEFLAVFFAIKVCIAKRFDLKDVIFEVDNQEVVHTIMVKGIQDVITEKLNMIASKKKPTRTVHLLYQQISVLKLLDGVIPPGGVVVELVSRKKNTLADALARGAVKLGIRRYKLTENVVKKKK